MQHQGVGTGDSDERPIRLGGALFTMVEPRPGQEVAYNRWYERDHFYAGCMIGAWTFAGARFVATRDLKAMRYPVDSVICPDPMSGSYLALYWVLAGKLQEWIRWGTDQVNWLHAQGRMFTERDHIHTAMYEPRAEFYARDDSVPAELALDRRFRYLVAVIGALDPDRTMDDVDEWSRSRPLGAELMLEFTPVPLLDDAPSDVPRDDTSNRFLQLYFVDDDIHRVWADRFAMLGTNFTAAGLGSCCSCRRSDPPCRAPTASPTSCASAAAPSSQGPRSAGLELGTVG